MMDQENAELRRRVEEIAGPIFEAALHGKQKKGFSDSTVRSSFAVCILWRPNNYRRQMMIKKTDDSTLKSLQDHYQKVHVTKKKIAFVYDDPRIILQVGRTRLTGIWAQRKIAGSKETFCIEADSIEGISKFVDAKVDTIRESIDAAMLEFVTRMSLGLHSNRTSWERHEDWFRGEEFIDKLPRKAIFYDERVKKVYDEGLEFQGGGRPAISMLTYLHEKSVEQVSPRIESRLSAIEHQQKLIIEMLVKLSEPRPVPVPKSQQKLKVLP